MLKIKFDKVLHALCCYAVTTGAYLILLAFARPWAAFAVSLLCGILAGAGQELYDKHTPGHVAERGDLIADAVGIAVAVALELPALIA